VRVQGGDARGGFLEAGASSRVANSLPQSLLKKTESGRVSYPIAIYLGQAVTLLPGAEGRALVAPRGPVEAALPVQLTWVVGQAHAETGITCYQSLITSP
jgi:hypothetical protein